MEATGLNDDVGGDGCSPVPPDPVINPAGDGHAAADGEARPPSASSPSLITALHGREPFSPLDAGHPLPYLDVLSVQSTRLLPATKAQLVDQQRHLRHKRHQAQRQARRRRLHPRKEPASTPAIGSDDESADDNEDQGSDHEGDDDEDDDDEDDEDLDGEDDDSDSSDDEDSEFLRLLEQGRDNAHAKQVSLNSADQRRLERLLASVRLLVEPVVIPDLTHTGVPCRLVGPATEGEASAKEEATSGVNRLTTEAVDEIKLFYPSGAKNNSMRDYIQDTIHKHLVGGNERAHVGKNKSKSKPSQSLLNGSHSLPTFPQPSVPVSADNGASGFTDDSMAQATNDDDATCPAKVKKPRQRKAGKSAYGVLLQPAVARSPTKGTASQVRLGVSVAPTSVLRKPERIREVQDVLAQLRANSNKITDLIG